MNQRRPVAIGQCSQCGPAATSCVCRFLCLPIPGRHTRQQREGWCGRPDSPAAAVVPGPSAAARRAASAAAARKRTNDKPYNSCEPLQNEAHSLASPGLSPATLRPRANLGPSFMTMKDRHLGGKAWLLSRRTPGPSQPAAGGATQQNIIHKADRVGCVLASPPRRRLRGCPSPWCGCRRVPAPAGGGRRRHRRRDQGAPRGCAPPAGGWARPTCPRPHSPPAAARIAKRHSDGKSCGED